MVVDLFDQPSPPDTATIPFTSQRISQLCESSDALTLAAIVAHLQREVGRLDAERRQAATDAGQLRRQLREAARVQRGWVPRSLKVPGAEVSTLYRPVAGVGGDVLALTRLGPGELAVSIADVSGHGVCAALMAPVLERALAPEWHDGTGARSSGVAEVMRRANHEMLACERRDGLCATAVHARYDSTSRTLRFARAGHPHPVLLRCGQRPAALAGDGLLLGALPDADWPVHEVTLQAGDRVVLYTDGLAELLATQQTPALDDRCVFSWATPRAALPAADLLADIQDRLEHAGWNAASADDVSVAVLTVLD